MAYEEYPKAMTHPGYRPAVVSNTDPKAAVFPPVTVMNADQEEYHRSLGYTAPNSDPAAHDHADVPNGYEPQEYPKWIGDELVNSAEEEAALIPVPDPDEEQHAAAPETHLPARPRVKRASKPRKRRKTPQKAAKRPETAPPKSPEPVKDEENEPAD